MSSPAKIISVSANLSRLPVVVTYKHGECGGPEKKAPSSRRLFSFRCFMRGMMSSGGPSHTRSFWILPTPTEYHIDRLISCSYTRQDRAVGKWSRPSHIRPGKRINCPRGLPGDSAPADRPPRHPQSDAGAVSDQPLQSLMAVMVIKVKDSAFVRVLPWQRPAFQRDGAAGIVRLNGAPRP